MKKFGIVGIAGFVAKKHLNCIKKMNGSLIAAYDKHDNVGFIDRDYPRANFFKKEDQFFSYIKKEKIDYLIICSPTHMHFRHIIRGLKAGVNIIVEKPPLLNSKNLTKISLYEKRFKKKCHCIFQLRVNKKIINLKKKIERQKNKKFEIEIFYNTFRGDWYFKSWKNDKKLSGGLAVNIGIHFFDILLWIFGTVKLFKLYKSTHNEVKGLITFEKAKANWLLSTKKLSKKSFKDSFVRYMTVNGKKFNFDKFEDLHHENYKKIIYENKFHISEFINTIKFIEKLKK
jgi:UDP-N-acetyl-2-amino-2-deoxyglucuronate dehydrogenase